MSASYHRRSGPERAFDFLKLLRSAWVTQDEVVDDLGWDRATVVIWLREAKLQGIIETRERESKLPGRKKREHRLAAPWLGTQEPGERL